LALNLNKNSLKELMSLQIKENFRDNKLLILTLVLQLKKQSLLNQIIESLKFEKNELMSYIEILSKNNFLSTQDIKLLENISKNKTTKQQNIEDVSIVIEHLNKVAKKRYTPDTHKDIILSKLKNHSVSDLKKVNLYFSKQWGSNPEMNKYLRPQTLYNTKFTQRLEEANLFFQELNSYSTEIEKICKSFPELITLESYSKDKLLTISAQNIAKELPLSLQITIIHWLKNNFNTDTIIETIKVTQKEWAKKPKLAQHISISKILDSKFPERVQAVKRILYKNNYKTGVIEGEEWLKKQERI
jgi:uncharacterized phage protein (TIGR02220 family)